MSRMVRKQIVMDPALEESLERHARDMGISQSQLVSRALQTFFDTADSEERRLSAWADFQRVACESEYGGQLPWTREGLHERGA